MKLFLVVDSQGKPCAAYPSSTQAKVYASDFSSPPKIIEGEFLDSVELATAQSDYERVFESLAEMLFIFDRALPDNSIGRQTCDKAKSALAARPKSPK